MIIEYEDEFDYEALSLNHINNNKSHCYEERKKLAFSVDT